MAVASRPIVYLASTAPRRVVPAGSIPQLPNYSLNLNGSSSFVAPAGGRIASGSAWTFSAWIRKPTTGVLQALYYEGTPANWSATNTLVIYAGDTTSSGLRVYVRDTNASGVLTPASWGTGTVNDGRWHHVAVTYGSNTLTAYIDGAPAGSTQSVTLGTFNSTVSRIGAGDSNGSFAQGWAGFVNRVRTWNQALSAAQISVLAAADVAPLSGLTLEYLLLEAAGAVLLDTSGNGNSGALTAAAYSTDAPPF